MHIVRTEIQAYYSTEIVHLVTNSGLPLKQMTPLLIGYKLEQQMMLAHVIPIPVNIVRLLLVKQMVHLDQRSNTSFAVKNK